MRWIKQRPMSSAINQVHSAPLWVALGSVCLVSLFLVGSSGVAASVKSPGVQRDSVSNAGCPPVLTFPLPPAGFSPLTASAADLQEYGFPPRPPGDNSAALAGWTQAMTAWVGMTPPATTCTLLPAAEGYKYNGSYSGYMVPNGVHGGLLYDWVSTTFTQPGVSNDPSYPGWVYFWAGLSDTDGTVEVVQAGTGAYNDPPQYFMWYENYPYQKHAIVEPPAINPGDTAYVFVEYNCSGCPAGDTDYWLENETTGLADGYIDASPDVSQVNAEFITERPDGLSLPDFTSSYFSFNDLGTYSQSWQLTSDSNDWTMTSNCQSNGTVLAKPSSPPNSSTGNFYSIWEHNQPYCNNCGHC
jgi:hypothetical protein